MKHFLTVLAAACALLALASPAMAGGGGLLGGGDSQDQTVENSTDQSNQAGAINIPVLSGNNVSVLSSGDQSSSAGTTQDQANANETSQQADQSQGSDSSQQQTTSNSTDQQNQAEAINVPIASGNNVALLSRGNQTSSAGVDQNQLNANHTEQKTTQTGSGSAPQHKHSRCKHEKRKAGETGNEQTVENRTEQHNKAEAINVPIASGNNVAALAKGNQTSSAGVDQNQLNANSTKQKATQADSGSSPEHKHSRCKHGKRKSGETGHEQTVENRTEQHNKAEVANVPVASGNNVALLVKSRCKSKSAQTSSAGVEQNQLNADYTLQEARHRGSNDGDSSWGDRDRKVTRQEQSLRDDTRQENEARALDVPILSGNNDALLSDGRQRSSPGVVQNQANVNSTLQEARQR